MKIPKIWLRGDGGAGCPQKKKQDQNPSFEKYQIPYGVNVVFVLEITRVFALTLFLASCIEKAVIEISEKVRGQYLSKPV